MRPTYEAKPNPDGTYSIFDVPVFGEVPKGTRRGLDIAIDREWMAKALERDQTRNSEGYMGPTHVRHHGDNVETIPAGRFRLRRVGSHMLAGKEVTALFADLIQIPAAVWQQIQDGGLPTRSVEVRSYADPEIGSLALLTSDVVPHFAFPLLDGSTVDLQEPAETFAAESVTALWVGETSDVLSFSFSEETNAMADDTKRFDEQGEQIAALKTSVDNLCALIAQSMGISKGAGNGPAGGSELTGEASPDPSRQMSSEKPDGSPEFAAVAAVAAKVDALELRDRQRTQAEAKRELYDWACEQLADRNLDKKAKERLLEHAGHGKETIEAVVTTFKATLPTDPPSSLSAAASAHGQYPDEVLRYQTQGDPALFEKAQEMNSQWQLLKGRPGMPDLKGFLALHVKELPA